MDEPARAQRKVIHFQCCICAPVGLARTAGEHDDRQLGVEAGGQAVGAAQAIEQRQPAAVLEAEVEHHQRRLPNLDRPQSLPHAAGPGDPEAVSGQVVEQERGDPGCRRCYSRRPARAVRRARPTSAAGMSVPIRPSATAPPRTRAA